MSAKELEIEVTALGAQGDGLADSAVGRLYVPFTLPGDRARVRLGAKKGDGYAADLTTLINPSSDRVKPVCQHFGTCGGCALQHLSTDAYRRFKRDRVEWALKKRGLDVVDIADPVILPAGNRRRTRFTARMGGRGLVLGYSGRSSHKIVDVFECPVLTPELEGLLGPLRTMLPTVHGGGALQITVTQTNSGPDMVLEGGGKLDLRKRGVLAAFAEETDLARLSWDDGNGPEPIVQRRPPTVSFGAYTIPLPAAAFLQASLEAEDWMGAFALDHVEAGPVADLFSGLGSFAFRLADKMPVTAIETDADMVDAIRQGAASHQAQKVQPERRDLFREPLTVRELNYFAAVVIDPPRAGAKAQSEVLADSDVPLIVAFSCNPASFARDSRLLVDGGYRLEKVVPIDQFRWSAHVELAAVFRR
ncbi:MAG: class I SAM-dependent RNA methyltransferase [Alphaproteobacteria bacterium]